jgi:hypothetical protein
MPLSFVRRSDGRLTPFDADRICQALFAASEQIGQPDAFLAREMTDSVVHFLADEADSGTVSTAQIAEVVEKVVRELGQPTLARAYAERRREPIPEPAAPSPAIEEALTPADLERRLGRACLRDHSLREVFSRDLAAAHTEGLLTLTTLETPGTLASLVLAPEGEPLPLADALLQARSTVGECIVLDGPEWGFATDTAAAIDAWTRELRLGLSATGLRAVVNLNSAVPPVWADDLARGPLFAARVPEHAVRQAVREALSDALLALPNVRIDWHLNETAFAAEPSPLLARLARRAAEGASLSFVFDRARRPVVLAEGVDRKHPAVLIAVGLHLPRLAQQPGINGQPDVFLKKLSSLVRLGLSVAKQKRDSLRRRSARRPELARGFLLDRARLLVVPVGLEAVCRSLAGPDLARQTMIRLRDTLRYDGEVGLVDGVLDASDALMMPPMGQEASSMPEYWAGVTSWAEATTARQQLKAADSLWSAGDGGTALVRLSGEKSLPPEEIVNLLRFVWLQTDVMRLRFVRLPETASAAGGWWSE